MKDALHEATTRESLTYRLVTAAREALPLLMAAHTTLKDVSPRASGQFLAAALRLSIAIDNHENTHIRTLIEDALTEEQDNGKQ